MLSTPPSNIPSLNNANTTVEVGVKSIKYDNNGYETEYYDEQGYPIMSYAKKDFELTWDAVVPNTNGEFWYELVKKPRHLKKMYKYQLEQQNQ